MADLSPSVALVVEYLETQGYKSLRVLEDGTIIGTKDLLYTRALVIDLTYEGFTHRYCYEDRSLATKACLALKTEDDPPLAGYVAQRHFNQRPKT